MHGTAQRIRDARGRAGSGFEACPGEAISPAAGAPLRRLLRAQRVPSCRTAPVAAFRGLPGGRATSDDGREAACARSF